MNRGVRNSLKSFLAELAVYAVLVTVYYFLVLHYLSGWLDRLFTSERRLYSGIALALIVLQGIALETLTRWLLAWVKSRTEAE